MRTSQSRLGVHLRRVYVLLIQAIIGKTQVFNPVAALVLVLVIDLRCRPFTMDVQPSNPMSQKPLGLYRNSMISL